MLRVSHCRLRFVSRGGVGAVKRIRFTIWSRPARISLNAHKRVKMTLMDTSIGIISWNSNHIRIHLLIGFYVSPQLSSIVRRMSKE
jgi:hypothetical protein